MNIEKCSTIIRPSRMFAIFSESKVKGKLSFSRIWSSKLVYFFGWLTGVQYVMCKTSNTHSIHGAVSFTYIWYIQYTIHGTYRILEP